jgi:Peptidoglycan-synthase activator LpoB
MKKRRFILWAFMLAFLMAKAQNKVIAIPSFSGKATIKSESRQMFENAFDRAAKKQGRFNIVERVQLEVIEEERRRQKSDEYVDATIAEQGKALGADYMIVVEIQAYNCADMFYEALGNYPAGRLVQLNVVFSAKMISAATGEVVFIHQQELSAKNDCGKSSPSYKQPKDQLEQELLSKLTKRFENYATGFLCQALVPDAQILEIKKTNGKKAAAVVIGTTAFFKEKTILEVYWEETIDIDGEKNIRKIPVGELVFEEMEGEKIGNCAVREGGKEILALFGKETKLKCAVKGWKIKYLFAEINSFESDF